MPLKRIFFVLLCSLIIGMTACSVKPAEYKKPDKIKTQSGSEILSEDFAENESLRIDFDVKACRFFVTDKKSGFVWHDCPKDAEENENLKGIQKMEVLSHLKIKYLNKSEKIQTGTSKAGSVNKRDYKVYKLENGFRAEYSFSSEGIVIPVEYTIDGDKFNSRVLLANVLEEKENKLISVSLLPSFGAGLTDENGYILTPDGSGGLINLNNGKNKIPYVNYFYGNDCFAPESFAPQRLENLYLPVFGMKREGNAFFAVIEKGDAFASLNASVSEFVCPYNLVSPEFILQPSETLSFQVQTISLETRILNLFAPYPSHLPEASVSYRFLSGDDSNYSAMAQLYKKILADEQILTGKAERKAVNLEAPLTTEKTKSFAGIPYKGQITLSSFDRLSEIVDLIANDKAPVNIVVKNWLSSGQSKKITSGFSFSGLAGSKNGYLSLSQKANVYLTVNPIKFSKGGNGFSKSNAIRDILNNPTKFFTYDLAGRDKKTDIAPDYVLSPNKIYESMEKLFASADKSKAENIALSDYGSLLYSDFNKKDIYDRGKTLDILESSLKEFKKGKVLTFGANKYLLKYVDEIADVPLSSSKFDIIDSSVPFYQMVVGEFKEMYSSSVTLEGSPKEALLKAVEFGCTPTFAVIANSPSLVKDTTLNRYYGTGFDDWKNDILNTVNRYENELSDITKGTILSHEKISEGLFKTTYKPGYILTNYNANDTVFDGVSVKSMDFTAVKK